MEKRLKSFSSFQEFFTEENEAASSKLIAIKFASLMYMSNDVQQPYC